MSSKIVVESPPIEYDDKLRAFKFNIPKDTFLTVKLLENMGIRIERITDEQKHRTAHK